MSTYATSIRAHMAAESSCAHRLHFHMAHSLTASFQQAVWIVQPCAVEKTYVDVSFEDVDVAERCIFHAGNRTSVMHQLADIVAAAPHLREPLTRNGAELWQLLAQPDVNSRGSFDGSREQEHSVHGEFDLHRSWQCFGGTAILWDESRPESDHNGFATDWRSWTSMKKAFSMNTPILRSFMVPTYVKRTAERHKHRSDAERWNEGFRWWWGGFRSRGQILRAAHTPFRRRALERGLSLVVGWIPKSGTDPKSGTHTVPTQSVGTRAFVGGGVDSEVGDRS